MRIRTAVLLPVLWAGLACAQSGAPAFRADRVLPSGGGQPVPLVPGMLVSIYGSDLGPRQGCAGQADVKKRETPSRLRPNQEFVETLMYPIELCGVQVLFGDTPSGLLYVQEGQINFKVPQETPLQGSAPLRVVYQGRSSGDVVMRLGLEPATLALEQPAYAGGPVWLRVQPPPFPSYGDVQYPMSVRPADFGCNEVEVRRNDMPLPRIAVRITGGIANGLICGSIGLPGHPMSHWNRLPLHLQYAFNQPGEYEVRYTRRRGLPGTPDSEAIFQTAWTRIEIQPAQRVPPAAPPDDPAQALADFLPGILGFPDSEHLALLVPYLYHPNDTVRQFAAQGLAYWPEDVVDRRLTGLLQTRGPSDVVAERTFRTPGAAGFILPRLQSEDPVLLRGAILGVTRLLFADPPLLSAGARGRAESALIAAAANALRVGGPQTGNDYVSALGGVHDARARRLLWDFVQRNRFTEQSLIAITWLKNPADLPRLATLLETPRRVDSMERTYASLPYAIHRAYGDAALPVLESALQTSAYVWVRTNCARELVQAGRKSGFAFIAQAIEQNKLYQREMVQFLQDRFPELQGAGDSQILAFLKTRQ